MMPTMLPSDEIANSPPEILPASPGSRSSRRTESGEYMPSTTSGGKQTIAPLANSAVISPGDLVDHASRAARRHRENDEQVGGRDELDHRGEREGGEAVGDDAADEVAGHQAGDDDRDDRRPGVDAAAEQRRQDAACHHLEAERDEAERRDVDDDEQRGAEPDGEAAVERRHARRRRPLIRSASRCGVRSPSDTRPARNRRSAARSLRSSPV